MSHANSIAFNIGSQYNTKWILEISYRWIREVATFELLNEGIFQIPTNPARLPTFPFYLNLLFIDIQVICWTSPLINTPHPLPDHLLFGTGECLFFNPLSINGIFIYTGQTGLT